MKSLLSKAVLPPLAAILALGLAGCRGVYERTEIDEEAQLEPYVTTATYLYEDGSLVRAQDQAVKALALDPDNQAMRRMIGWIRLRQGRTEDLIIAERFFRDLLDDGDESAATVLGLATVLERMGLAHDEAAEAYASGERKPSGRLSAERKAREQERLARRMWREAIELYESTLVEDAGSTRALNGLQRVHALLGEYEESLSRSRSLLEVTSAELADWTRMLSSEDLTESEENMLRSNEREAATLQYDTHLFRASLLEELERFDEAVAELDAVVALRPERAELYSHRAELLARSGGHARAIRDLDDFLRLSELPFEHADVQRAFELRAQCESALGESD
jgi:tetratricopeptide (TPR) repeat protein